MSAATSIGPQRPSCRRRCRSYLADAQLKVALFSDAGSLWATNASGAASLASLSPSQQIANSRAIRSSVGASLIWDSPFGALRVDYAYPIAKQPYDVTQRLKFTAGGF